LKGKSIKTSLNKNQIKVDSTPSGIYLLEIKDKKSGQKIAEHIVIGR